MNNLYNIILNEVLSVYDFDSWDDSEQTFKGDIEKHLNKRSVLNWFDKNYLYQTTWENNGGSSYDNILLCQVCRWNLPDILLKTEYKDLLKDPEGWIDDEDRETVIKYTIAEIVKENGGIGNGLYIVSSLNNSKINFHTRWIIKRMKNDKYIVLEEIGASPIEISILKKKYF